MTQQNPSMVWSRVFIDELVRSGVSAVCLVPGSRSTSLVMAVTERDDIAVFSHLDERSAAFFALGRAKRTGEPTPIISTSGTAAVEFHPAVVEANQSRTPMLVLTADRPRELQESGANQTINQEELYGGAVRWYRSLPEPTSRPRTLRMLRTTAARAVATCVGDNPGPVHLNFPFRKPFEPITEADEGVAHVDEIHPQDGGDEGNAYVQVDRGRPTLKTDQLASVVGAVDGVKRGLIVVGPSPVSLEFRDAIVSLAESTGFPVLADPLSGVRFGNHVTTVPVCGGYDAYLDPEITQGWPDPDVVLRFGATPTSTQLQDYLGRTDPRQFVVDPVGEWREATFTASDLVISDPTWLASRIAEQVENDASQWLDRFQETEAQYWEIVDAESRFFEGAIVSSVLELAPETATVFVSNSMPVRDLDRFGQPVTSELTVLGNRGASGIDGITSTALGAGSATDDPLILVTGDLAYYHDMNGLLALERCDIEATVVEINNDGGGIFHLLPIADFDPPFTDQFKTPHGLDFSSTGDLYGFSFTRVDSISSFQSNYEDAFVASGSHVIEVESDAPTSHSVRDELHQQVCSKLSD